MYKKMYVEYKSYENLKKSNLIDKLSWDIVRNKLNIILLFSNLYWGITSNIIYLLIWLRSIVLSFNNRLALTVCIIIVNIAYLNPYLLSYILGFELFRIIIYFIPDIIRYIYLQIGITLENKYRNKNLESLISEIYYSLYLSKNISIFNKIILFLKIINKYISNDSSLAWTDETYSEVINYFINIDTNSSFIIDYNNISIYIKLSTKIIYIWFNGVYIIDTPMVNDSDIRCKECNNHNNNMIDITNNKEYCCISCTHSKIMSIIN